MSDLFISELLVFVFLLPVLLRPFSASLKNAAAVLLLPVFAIVLSILIIIGQGCYFSSVLALVFSILVFLFSLPKFSKFVVHLPTRTYSTAEIVIMSILLVCAVPVLVVIFTFVPMRTFKSSDQITNTEIVLDEYPGTSFGTVSMLDNADNEKPCIIFLPNIPYSSQETNTIASYFVEQSYKVIKLTRLKKIGIPIKNFYNFITAFSLLFNKEFNLFTESKFLPASTDSSEISAFLTKIIEKYAGDSRVFIFSDGIYNDIALQYPQSDSVHTCILTNKKFSPPNGAFLIDKTKEVSFDKTARYANQLIIIDDDKNLPGFADMAADDVLAARLLGGTIDVGRENRLNIAAILEKWIYVTEVR